MSVHDIAKLGRMLAQFLAPSFGCFARAAGRGGAGIVGGLRARPAVRCAAQECRGDGFGPEGRPDNASTVSGVDRLG